MKMVRGTGWLLAIALLTSSLTGCPRSSSERHEKSVVAQKPPASPARVADTGREPARGKRDSASPPARPPGPAHPACATALPPGFDADLSKAPAATLLRAVIPGIDEKRLFVATHDDGEKKRCVVHSCNGGWADAEGDEGCPARRRARPRLTHRLPVGDGRLAVQVQTGERSGAPESDISGFLAVLRRRGDEVIATVVRPLGLEEAEIRAVEDLGGTRVLVLRKPHLGTGGGESADGQCLLSLEGLHQLICITTRSRAGLTGGPVAVSTSAKVTFGAELVVAETRRVTPRPAPGGSISVEVTTRYRLESGKLVQISREQRPSAAQLEQALPKDPRLQKAVRRHLP